MKIVFNADDFGLSKGVCDGILESHLNGVVLSTTIMPNAPYYDYAVSLAKANPTLNVGVHLVATYGKPLRDDVPTLTNSQGFMKRVDEDHPLDVNPDELYQEWCTQIEKVMRDLPITHFDSHHHIHLHPQLKEVVEKLSITYNLPYRGVTTKDKTSIKLIESFYKEGVTLETIESILKNNNEIVDVMTHPAIVDDLLNMQSSYGAYRAKELDLLCSDSLKYLLRDYKVTICSYKSIL